MSFISETPEKCYKNVQNHRKPRGFDKVKLTVLLEVHSLPDIPGDFFVTGMVGALR